MNLSVTLVFCALLLVICVQVSNCGVDIDSSESDTTVYKSHEIVSRASYKTKALPVYFINMATDYNRLVYIKKLLKSSGFGYIKRIPAWIPRHVKQRVKLNVTSSIKTPLSGIDYSADADSHPYNLRSQKKDANAVAKFNELTQLKELGCISSHLFAMYTAITDEKMKHIPYALIVEDDIRFELKVNWLQMIEISAPRDWKILQVFTSNAVFSKKLWKDYQSLVLNTLQNDTTETPSAKQVPFSSSPLLQWVERYSNSSLWSTQAYLINKEAMKSQILSIVSYHKHDQKYHLTLPPPPSFHCNVYTSKNQCVLPYRLVADIYLYTLFAPSYITRIPFCNGAKRKKSYPSHKDTINESGEEEELVLTNVKETIQSSKKLTSHSEQFEVINKLINEIKYSSRHLLPSYFYLSTHYNVGL
jgi:GR25 family glycosyltransferase involved in LPS biosynthesis